MDRPQSNAARIVVLRRSPAVAILFLSFLLRCTSVVVKFESANPPIRMMMRGSVNFCKPFRPRLRQLLSWSDIMGRQLIPLFPVLFLSISQRAEAQPIVFASSLGGTTVNRVTAPNGVVPYATGLNTPRGITFDAAGNLYVTAIAGGAGTLQIVPPGGGPGTTFATGFSTAIAVKIGPDGNFYVTNGGNNTVSRVGPGGGAATLYATGFNAPGGLAFGGDGSLYVANILGDSVSRVPPGGGAASVFATGFNVPEDIAFDSAGNLYATNRSGNNVSRVGPGGGVASVFATGFVEPWGLAFDILGSGDLYVANQSDSSISRIGPAGGVAEVYAFNVPSPGFLAMRVPEPSNLASASCAAAACVLALRKGRKTLGPLATD